MTQHGFDDFVADVQRKMPIRSEIANDIVNCAARVEALMRERDALIKEIAKLKNAVPFSELKIGECFRLI